MKIVDGRSGDIHLFPHQTGASNHIGHLPGDAMAKASRGGIGGLSYRKSKAGRPMRAGQGDKSRDRRQEFEGILQLSTCQAAGCLVPVAFNAKITPLLKAATIFEN
ncbi:hypothetical protein [Mesorhizobium sp. AA22]|uniref:hypothetical protein n=1 Tax=Mesorhizobium sp. AA22 TaxID=1854057 RepID=UPI001FEE38A0|nr:hypothetical protein [Mesorhizobium sp. AA22]